MVLNHGTARNTARVLCVVLRDARPSTALYDLCDEVEARVEKARRHARADRDVAEKRAATRSDARERGHGRVQRFRRRRAARRSSPRNA